jgi:hypothetical protein
VPLYPPQIEHDFTPTGTRAAEVGRRRLNRLSYGTAQVSKYFV